MQGEGAQVVQTPGGVQASVMLIADPVPGVVHTVNEERLESDVPGNSYASFGGGRLEKCPGRFGVTRWPPTLLPNIPLLEGINNKIQLIKRTARGYKDTETFKRMIYLCFGCLELKFE